MNIDDAVKQACEEPDLASALTWICIWESERVVKQVKQIGLTGTAPESGGGWSTFFGICIRQVTEAWKEKKMDLTELALHHESCTVMNGASRCTCDVTKGVEKIVRRCSGELVATLWAINEQARHHGGGNADFVFLRAFLPIVRKHVQAALASGE